jgi:TRAP-type C4-dicarboxylate transport system permease small subunit
MRMLRFIDRHLEELLCVFLLAAMTFVVFAQIVMKWLHLPLAWSEEVARYLFIYAVYVGAAFSTKKLTHQKVDVMTLLVKERGQLVLNLISDLGVIAFAFFMMIYGWQVVNNIAFVHVSRAPATHINMGWAYAAPAIGMTLCVIRSIQNIFFHIRTYKISQTKDVGVKGGGY